jgi:hypothetical protein
VCGATFLSLTGTQFFIDNPEDVAVLMAKKQAWDRLTLGERARSDFALFVHGMI